MSYLTLQVRPSVATAPSPVGLPDSHLTPGSTNPNISQENIDQTICNPHWSTKSIRPPVSYTNPLKKKSMVEYGDTAAQPPYVDANGNVISFDVTQCVAYSNDPRCHELDHLISLELGGSPTDPKNLWPEPYNIQYGAHQKDKVENYLHDQVCLGNITLKDAQYQISHDWITVYNEMQ
jgi:hypothetical protein